MREALRRRLIPWLGLLAGMALVYRSVLQGRVMAGRDAFRIFIPDSAFLLEALHAGELPLWNPYLRLGQPFAATLYSQVFYPPRLLTVLLAGPELGLTLQHLLHVAIAAAGTFLLLRHLRASRPAAVLGSAAFALSAPFAVLSAQQNVASAAAWTGFLLLASRRAALQPSPCRAAQVAPVAGLAFLAGSPETWLWQAPLALAVALAARREMRTLVATGAGLAWGFALGALVALPALEFARNSTRGSGRMDQLEWSLSWPQLLSVAWPFAEHPRSRYWAGDDQFFILVLFLGTLVCALALVGLGRSRRTLPFGLGALVLTLLALGAHFPPAALVLQLPPFHLFRYPVKYFVGAAFCLAVLSAFGLDVLSRRARRGHRSLKHIAGVVAALFVALLLGPPLTRLPSFRSGVEAGLPWVVLALGAGALAFILPAAGPGRALRVRRSLTVVALVELGAFHLMQGGTGSAPLESLRRASRLAAAIPREYTGRVSVDLDSDELSEVSTTLSATAAPLPGEGGSYIALSRDALVPNRFVEERLRVFEGYGAPEPLRIESLYESGARAAFDLAGVGYYVRRGPPPFEDLQPVLSLPGLPTLYRSDTALPRAFVVHTARVAGDAETQAAFVDPTQPLRRTALLAEGDPLESPDCEGSSARVTEAGLSWVEVALEACGPGYLLLSDSYYPGWEATLDGAPVPVRRANAVMRAVHVPPGAHSVRFDYRPLSFRLGALLSALALGALVLALRPRKDEGRPL
ncbi:YfhO family protein [Archangium lansingense]|uniref:YfhO family protein n=1 Tax=Archangium lansingense TaxID=2995310 RepID=A0ABT4AEU3_9BACT|nr:YfhO family protein [Archangium lansinium]MCY1080202.1 YfhO family protein [Archangium lansinium]